jgi:NADH-quinone oxidoreductase subunit B
MAAKQDINSPGFKIPDELRQQVTITTLERIYNWGRSNSMWPQMFGLACCAIEMICTAASRYDFSRFGMEVMRPSPRQADVMIVAGTVTKKMLPQIVRLYDQLSLPKYVVAMGACACGGGPFKDGYNVVPGIDTYIPVDVYITGCPPTPQSLINGLISLQNKVKKEQMKKTGWYSKEPVVEVPIPVLGPDVFDPRKNDIIYAETHKPEEIQDEEPEVIGEPK